MTRPKYIPTTRRFRGKIYHYHSHGPSVKMMQAAKKLRVKGWLSHTVASGRPGVSVVYWRRG